MASKNVVMRPFWRSPQLDGEWGAIGQLGERLNEEGRSLRGLGSSLLVLPIDNGPCPCSLPALFPVILSPSRPPPSPPSRVDALTTIAEYHRKGPKYRSIQDTWYLYVSPILYQ